MIGKTISHYRIIEELGRGGMGVVYKAEDTRLKRIVALKFLAPSAVGSREEKTRFVHEALAAAALNHPNICTIHEIDEVDGPWPDRQTFIAMEYIDGQSLKEKIQSGLMKIEEALDIAVQIVEGLQEAHQHGIVHRDIKPANIMITTKGQAKIMDFGLAKLSGRTKVTKTGTTLGTAAYMSPEQARGEVVDHRTDIWSFGVVLYEMITGQLPFRGDYEQAVIYSILHEEPKPITAFRSDIPSGLEKILSRCLKKSPEERYANMGELLEELLKVREELSSGSLPAARRPYPAAKRSARRLLWAGGAIILLAVLVLAGVRFFANRGTTSIPTRENPLVSLWKNSIAVLPFEDLSPQRDQEYFCDGLTDDIITKLSNIRELKVINRTSVLRYRNTTKDIKQIGAELGVATVLQGSIRREGKRVRINAQLVNIDDGFNLWAKSYDFQMQDLFAVQEEVSQAIARALQVKFSPQTLARFEAQRPADLEFYEYQLKTSYFVNRFLLFHQEQDFQKALEMSSKMLAIDSTDARPYLWLAWSYQNHYEISGNPEDHERVLEFCQKAYQLNPNLAETIVAMGWVYYSRKDYEKAFQFYSQALQRNPNESAIHHVIGIFYTLLGLWEQARLFFRQAFELDPFYLYSVLLLADSYLNVGQFAEAMIYYKKALELAPNNADVNCRYADLLIRTKRYREAEEAIRKAEEYQPGFSRLPYYKALLFAAKGRKEEALAQMEAPPAEVYALLGMNGEAIESIARHHEQPRYQYLQLRNNPYFVPLQRDPRFKRVIARQKKVYEERVSRYGKMLLENP